MIDLQAAGLSATEAKVYQALISRPDWRPSVLAKTVSETRTNMYKVLDELVSLGLAEKFDKDRTFHYRAVNPSRLLELAQEQKSRREQAEKSLQVSVAELTYEFIKTSEQPGIRYFQGKEEITTIFEEIAESKEEVLFVHTLAGSDFYGFNTMHKLRMLAPAAGVSRRALTQDGPTATKDFRITDPKVKLKRTWLKNEDYTCPVEWGAFDEKLYIISYGSDALGLVIESRPIADAFKQLFKLLETGQREQPSYKNLPRLASKLGVTSTNLK